MHAVCVLYATKLSSVSPESTYCRSTCLRLSCQSLKVADQAHASSETLKRGYVADQKLLFLA